MQVSAGAAGGHQLEHLTSKSMHSGAGSHGDGEAGCKHPIAVSCCVSRTASSQCLLGRWARFHFAGCFRKEHTDTAVKCLDPLRWGHISVNKSNLRWQMVSPGCTQNMVLAVSWGSSVLKTGTSKLMEIGLILNSPPEKQIPKSQAAIIFSTCRSWP